MRLLCKWGFHKWELRKYIGNYEYYECVKCKTRKYCKNYRGQDDNYIDWDWLMDCPNPRYTDYHGVH